MKKFMLVPIILLASTIQLNGALSSGAAALRRAGQQFVPQVQRASMSTLRSSQAMPIATRSLSRSSLLAPRAGLFGSQQPATQEFTCPAGMQRRYMASFWANPFTYSERKEEEERLKAVKQAKLQAEQAANTERNRVRDMALKLFGLKEQYDNDIIIYDHDTALGVSRSFARLLEQLGTEMATPKGRKLVVTLMQRDPEQFSTESIAGLLSYPYLANKLLVTDEGIALLKYMASKDAEVVVPRLRSLNREVATRMLYNQGPALTDLLINNPALERAFDGYIKFAVANAGFHDYYKNPFVTDFLTRNPQVAANLADSISSKGFDKINREPIGKPLFSAILSSPEASKLLANSVGWAKLEDWREANMPEQLSLPEAEQLALPAASAERVDINE